jgi:hypothetical protein
LHRARAAVLVKVAGVKDRVVAMQLQVRDRALVLDPVPGRAAAAVVALVVVDVVHVSFQGHIRFA